MRIGYGYDVHQLVEAEKLVIGGIVIPHDKGLKGHSDADVLLHAITDALLGALALGDIGAHFPDTDPVYENADSRLLLKKSYELIQKKGFKLVNIDATIVAENPKFRPYINDMRACIAQDLGSQIERVSVKATTSEKMGFVGREEGIAVHAVVLIQKKN